jgi:putative transposase
LEAEKFYHIYNHANGKENLFGCEENYQYFLHQWAKYIEPIANTYAYCLMPNHIHILISIKLEKEVSEHFGFTDDKPFGKFQTFQKLISKQFANFFSSYTQAFNKMYQRKGSLFIPNFKRKEITSEDQLLTLICYIHRNPIHHGFCKNFIDWKHSSYTTFLSEKDTKIQREFVINKFDDLENYIACHEQQVEKIENPYFLD